MRSGAKLGVGKETRAINPMTATIWEPSLCPDSFHPHTSPRREALRPQVTDEAPCWLHTWNWAVGAQGRVRWTPQPETLQHTPAEHCAAPWGPEGALGQDAAFSLGAGHGGWGEKELPLKMTQMRVGPAFPALLHSRVSVLCLGRLCHQTGPWGSVIRAGALAVTTACPLCW